MHDECNPSACANTLRSALDGSRLILLFKGDIADPRILSWRTEAVDLELLIACMCPYGLEIDIVAKMYSASPFISHPPERQMSFPSCTGNIKLARLTHNIDVDPPIKSGNRPPDSCMIDRRNPSVALRARSADSTDTAFSPSAPSAAVARRCRRA